jgi:hypothetical protein
MPALPVIQTFPELISKGLIAGIDNVYKSAGNYDFQVLV